MPDSRQERTIAYVAVILSAIAVISLAGLLGLWILPELLTQGSTDSLTDEERLKAANDVRAPVIAFVVAIGALGTLLFTARTYILARDKQTTDLFSKAVDQLGDDDPAVRTGGIYSLTRVGHDSPQDRPGILAVLELFVRTRSSLGRIHPSETDPDVKAALAAAAALLAKEPRETLNLEGILLDQNDITESGLSVAQIRGPKG